jgi:cyclopropane fatty-acyl-phospholipid synthase-like methyltransferase
MFGISAIPGYDFHVTLIFIIERIPVLVGFTLILPFIVKKSLFFYAILAIPLALMAMTIGTITGSWEDAQRRGYDLSLPSLRAKLDDYVMTGNDDLNRILNSDKYAPTFGLEEVTYLLKDAFADALLHLDHYNKDNIAEGYNKGNDWFEATLGEPMVYTSGIYKHGNETLKEAQEYKLDYVANAIELKKGDKVLDIGCGWGRLIHHFTTKYGADMTGITLSTEQRQWGMNLNKDNNAKILLQDGMKMHERTDNPKGGFDKITSLEMAEHVGIKRYQEFLKEVHNLLKEDGIFYFQVAGLRRHWRYEDLVWGLFMMEHVFPGADASLDIGWVSTQLERAGFEVQRVNNLGTHYSRTLDQWLEVWRANKDKTTNTYGAKSYRRWEVFLAWSVRVARQGSSTVFMITATKQGQKILETPRTAALREARRIQTQKHIVPIWEN